MKSLRFLASLGFNVRLQGAKARGVVFEFDEERRLRREAEAQLVKVRAELEALKLESATKVSGFLIIPCVHGVAGICADCNAEHE